MLFSSYYSLLEQATHFHFLYEIGFPLKLPPLFFKYIDQNIKQV